jgi:hypothetical protein
MALLPATRTGLTKYTAGTDPHPGRVKHNEQIDLLDSIVALGYQGTPAARPAAGKAARFFWDENAKRLAWDDGTAWQDLNPNGGGGAGRALVIGGNGAEGESSRSARADHTHPLPLASATVNGAMAAGDKDKLDRATDAATNGTLMRRDSSGRVAITNPTAAGHATPKSYVDGLISQAATYASDVAREIASVVTSTTRPSAPVINQEIYETDTKRTLKWDGEKWVVWHQPWTTYAPYFSQEWGTLGSGHTKGGEYTIVSPGLVKAGAWVTIGAGGSTMASYFPSVGLPFKSGSYGLQGVDGFFVDGGGGGPMKRLIGAIGGGATGFQVFSWPQVNTYMHTLAQDGYTLTQGDLVHFSFTYRAEIPA